MVPLFIFGGRWAKKSMQLQHRQESFPYYFYVAELVHTFLPSFCFPTACVYAITSLRMADTIQ